MPIDPRVALGVQPIQIDSPMQTLAQIAGLQNMQAQQEYRRAQAQQQEAAAAAAQAKAAEEAKQQAETTQFQKQFGGLPRADRARVLATLPPDLRMRSETRLAAFDKFIAEADEAESKVTESQSRVQAARLKALGQLAQGVAEYGDDPEFGYNPQAAEFAFATAAEKFGDVVGRQWEWVQEDPQRRLKPFIDQMIAQGTEEPEGVVVQPGQEIRSKIGGRLIAKGQTKPEAAPAVGSFEDYVIRYAKLKGTTPENLLPADIEEARKRYGQADDRIVITPPGMLPPRTETTVRELSGRFSREPAVRRSTVMAEAAQFVRGLDVNTKNPADQQALIYAFAKVMDPESVVREGEYETVRKYAQAWTERFGFDVQRVFDSNAPLMTPEAMQRMKETISSRYQAGLPQYKNIRDQYVKAINKATGLNDAQDRIVDYSEAFPVDAIGGPEASGGRAVAPIGGGGGGGVSVKAPNGKTYTFPSQAEADAFKKRTGIQ